MASSPFPARKSQGAGGMTSTGPGSAGQLDGPPPSPAMQGAEPPVPGMTGDMMAQSVPSFEQLAPPLTAGTPGRALSPEISVGIMQSAQTISSMFDSMASIVPDLANDFALQKDLLQRTMAKLFVSSGQQGAPQSTGMNFPGGGFASGTM